MSRKSQKPPQSLTETERLALMAAIKSPRDRCIFRLAMDRGLRASEVGLIRLEDWSVRTKRISVRRLKGSISQDYALSTEELRALRSWMRVRGKGPRAALPATGAAGSGATCSTS